MFKRVIALPQDHGSWVFLLSPLLIGLFIGGAITLASVVLILTALAAFLLRQPLSIAVKVWGGRRARSDLRPARIGIRQLIVSTLFTVLFILLWR